MLEVSFAINFFSNSSNSDSTYAAPGSKFTHVHEHTFIRDHFQGIGKRSTAIGWLVSHLHPLHINSLMGDYNQLTTDTKFLSDEVKI